MNDDSDRLIYLAIGPFAAMVLGVLLIPLRDYTNASNLTLLFLVLTIVVAEFGGRWAAVATALVSALSLDFFLTQPYLRLAIQDKHDIIAFVGLAVCGLVAAALGSKRGERVADLRAARRQQDALHTALIELERGTAIEYSATRLLDACRAALSLAAIVVRDNQNNVLAARPDTRPVPELMLQADSLLPPGVSDRVLRQEPLPLPHDGGRLALKFDGRQVGWLDVWGGDAPVSAESRRALADVARVVAAMLVLGKRGAE